MCLISSSLCSDDDVHSGKPQIAMDEDLSTPEEEEEEEAPPLAPPTSTASKPSPALQTGRPSAILKSAKDIELTESEEEDDTPNVIADEDIEKSTPAAPLTTKKTKDVLSGELFEVEPSADKKKKPAKSSGLMLQFNLPPSPPQPKKTASEKERRSPKDTPDQSETRRDSNGKKKKKSKKSRHTKEEEAEVAKLDGGSGQGVAQVPPVVANDPFGAISALDAWLNSDSADPMVLLYNIYVLMSR